MSRWALLIALALAGCTETETLPASARTPDADAVQDAAVDSGRDARPDVGLLDEGVEPLDQGIDEGVPPYELPHDFQPNQDGCEEGDQRTPYDSACVCGTPYVEVCWEGTWVLTTEGADCEYGPGECNPMSCNTGPGGACDDAEAECWFAIGEAHPGWLQRHGCSEGVWTGSAECVIGLRTHHERVLCADIDDWDDPRR